MSRHFTIQQVEQHNVKQVFDPYAVIEGGVYRLKKVPWEQCNVNQAAVQAALFESPDVSALFAAGPSGQGGNTLTLLKSANGCHVGNIAQAPAGVQQGQPRHGYQRRDGPAEAEREAKAKAAAEKQRREEARKSRLRKAYNPHKQHPEDADEYPADAVAMGYLPDLDGRRWRERRMRLSRYIQFHDMPAIDDADIDSLITQALDLDFTKEIVYKKHLRGGEARRCTGSFRAARPPPPRSQLRPRRQLPVGKQDPPPRGPPDSDSDDDDNNDDDSPDAPALRAQPINVEGRVRPWAESNVNRTRAGPGQQATPPVTPGTRTALNTPRHPTGPPTRPPPAPPQHPQQRTPEEEQEIAKRNREREKAEAEKLLLQQAQKAQREAWDKEREAKRKGGDCEQQEEDEQQKKDREKREPEEARQRRLQRQQQRKKAEEDRKRREEEERMRKEEEERKKKEEEQQRQQQRNKAEEDRKKRQEEERKKKEEEDKRRQQEYQQKKQKVIKKVKEKIKSPSREDMINMFLSSGLTLEQAEARIAVDIKGQRVEPPETDVEEQNNTTKEIIESVDYEALVNTGMEPEVAGLFITKNLREEVEPPRAGVEKRNDTTATTKDPDAANLEKARQETLRHKEESERTLKEIRDKTEREKQDGGLIEPPGTTKDSNKPTPTGKNPTGKRHADTTAGGENPGKKPRLSEPNPAPKNTGNKYDDSNRPYKPGEEPWNKDKKHNPLSGLFAGTMEKDPEEGDIYGVSDDSEDELAWSIFPIRKSRASGSRPSQAPGRSGDQDPPAAGGGGSTSVNYTRVPEVPSPAELFPQYSHGSKAASPSLLPGELPAVFPPAGGILTTSPDGKKAKRAAGSGPSYSLRSSKRRQARR